MNRIDSINYFYKKFAIQSNPYGYYKDQINSPPICIKELKEIAEYHDSRQIPFPARFIGSEYEELAANTGFVAENFVAWHDRVHILLNADFNAEGESRVNWFKYCKLRDRNYQAASLHLLVSFIYCLYWFKGGKGLPVNIHYVIKKLYKRIRIKSFLIIKENQVFKALKQFEEQAGEDFLKLCQKQS